MMILSAMQDHQFQTYLDYFIPDYTVEISANYGLSATAAEAQARREIAGSLPDGPATAGQTLLCIYDSDHGQDSLIGYIWYCLDQAARSAFLYDFHIRPAHQGKGYGKAALHALETALGAMGFVQIRLRVAADNERAQHVYRSTGFRTTGVNMSKMINPGPASV